MHPITIMTSAFSLAALTTAAPLAKRNPSLKLDFNTLPGMSNASSIVTYPIEINVLTAFDFAASGISIDIRGNSQFDLKTVECRAYKDEAGLDPASVPFSMAQKASFGTSPVEVGSVLCYTV